MNFGKLASGIFRRLDEDTTSAAIAYLPSGFQSVKKAIQDLGILKPRWKVKVLEQDNNVNVDFEDKLRIQIPKEHYGHFTDNVLEVADGKEVDFKGLFKAKVHEASVVTTVRTGLVRDIKEAFESLPVVMRSLDFLSAWQTNFKGGHPIELKGSALSLYNYRATLSSLMRQIVREYGTDRGYLETLLSKLEEKQALNDLDIFKGAVTFAGDMVKVDYEGVDLMLTLSIGLDLRPQQRITVSEDAVAEEMEYYRDVNVVNNTIMPKGEMFSNYVIKNLKDVIDSVEERKDGLK